MVSTTQHSLLRNPDPRVSGLRNVGLRRSVPRTSGRRRSGLQQRTRLGEDVSGRDGEERGIRIGRPDVTATDGYVREHPVRPGWRTPEFRTHRPEEDDGGTSVSAREVRDTGVDGDHECTSRDARTELLEPEASTQIDDLLTFSSTTGEQLLGGPDRRRGPRTLDLVPGDEDPQPLPHEPCRDRPEPFDRPMTTAELRPDVDEGEGVRSAGLRERSVRRPQRSFDDPADTARGSDPHVGGIPGKPVLPEESDPAFALVERGVTGRAPGSTDRLPDVGPRFEPHEKPAAGLPVAVEVHRRVDRPQSCPAEPFGERRVLGAGAVDAVVDRVDRPDEGCEALGGREHDPMMREPGTQPAQRGHRDEQIAEPERAQDDEHRSVDVDPTSRTTDRAVSPTLAHRSLPRLVLFDRDDTLVLDVPYNGDPARVVPVPGARTALEAVRAKHVRTGVVTNQSGIGRGILTRRQVDAVNARVEQLLGPFDLWEMCPHAPEAGCACRKPAPGMILSAALRCRIDPADIVVIGDIGADVEAARAAGAHGILVPTRRTLPEEVEAAGCVASDLVEAVDLVLEGVRS